MATGGLGVGQRSSENPVRNLYSLGTGILHWYYKSDTSILTQGQWF
jgi:hypothetical protein